MELNGIQPQGAPRASGAQHAREDPSTALGGPLTVPEGDGVLAAFEADGPADEGRDPLESDGDRLARALDQESIRTALAKLAEQRLPTSAMLSISVDPETEQARFAVLNRATGEVIREVPDSEMALLLRAASRGPGQIVDRVL